jgi:hypothetical protein
MKKTVQQISFLILALSLNLVWASISFDDSSFSQNHISICNECSDLSDPCEYFHSICCEDDSFMPDSKIKSNIFKVRRDKGPFPDFNFRNSYVNDVWQPPKSC